MAETGIKTDRSINEIIAALHQAAEDFENGELIEVRDLLQEIINAIDGFADHI